MKVAETESALTRAPGRTCFNTRAAAAAASGVDMCKAAFGCRIKMIFPAVRRPQFEGLVYVVS